nr:hypothetical protein [Rubrobacter sp.]
MKKLTLLAGMLAVVLLAAVPALAQSAPEEQSGEPEGGEPVTATGVLERPEMTTYQYGTHAITDEASGTLYALQSEDEALLDNSVGERVTVEGTTDP